MKKFVLLVLAVLLACPAVASAAGKQLYVEVSGITSATEFEGVIVFEPEMFEYVTETVTVKVATEMLAEVMEAITAQKIALLTVDNQYVAGGKTVIEAGSVRPAIYFGVMVGYIDINADENAVWLNLSQITSCEIVFPEDIDVTALLPEIGQGARIRAIQFSPAVYENEPYIRKVSAKDVSFPMYAYGFIAEADEEYVSVNVLPFDDFAYPEIINTDTPPVRFALTEDTIWAEQLPFEPVGTNVIVLYDEETMEALALLFYHG